jgi:FAD/FMN-containing dehydrogenase
MLLYPLELAAEVVAFYRDFVPTAPPELTLYCGLLSAPDGTPVSGLVGCYSGPLEEAEAALAPVRGFGAPIADLITPLPYVAMQSMLDEAFPAGLRYRWRSAFLDELPAEAIEVLSSAAATRPSPMTKLILEHYGDGPGQLADDATAFPHRAPQLNLVIIAQWSDPADDDENEAWLRRTFEAMRPFCSGRVYANAVDRGEDRVHEAFGANYERLLALKRRWDPDNLFRFNTNIDPA